MDLDSHSEEGIFFYILLDNLGYDLILGLSWLKWYDNQLEVKRGRLYFYITGARIYYYNKGL